MPREENLEKAFVKVCKGLGFRVRKAKWIGVSGCPDRYVWGYGRSFWVELKRPDGKGEVSPLQEREMSELRAGGMNACVIATFEELAAFEKVLQEVAF